MGAVDLLGRRQNAEVGITPALSSRFHRCARASAFPSAGSARVRVGQLVARSDRESHSLRHGHELEDVAVEVLEVEPAAAVPVVKPASSRLQGPLPKASPAACTRGKIASNSASLT